MNTGCYLNQLNLGNNDDNVNALGPSWIRPLCYFSTIVWANGLNDYDPRGMALRNLYEYNE